MTDSIRVFPPGFQVTNAAGTPQAGAVLRFYDAGTSNTRTVYSNFGLTTSLGVTVTTDSSGRPAASGGAGAEVEIYTGTGAYKVTAETALAVSLWSFDNVVGALDTSAFITPGIAIPKTIISTKTADYSIVVADQGTLFNADCSSGDIHFTLPSAITAGNGFRVGVKHIGSLHRIGIASVGGQTIDNNPSPGFPVLPFYGAARWLVSDGANWFADDVFDPIVQIGTLMAGATYAVDLRPLTSFNRVRFQMVNLKPATNGASFIMKTSTNGGATYDGGGGDYSWGKTQMTIAAGAVLVQSGSVADSSISLLETNSNVAYSELEIVLSNQSNAANAMIRWTGMQAQGGTTYHVTGGATRLAATDVDAVQFSFSAGAIATGTCSVYGDQ